MSHDSVGFIAIAITLVVLIIWGPTLLVFRRRLDTPQEIPRGQLGIVLAGELIVFVLAALLLDMSGLHDPGGYVIAVGLVIGAVGPHVLTRIRL